MSCQAHPEMNCILSSSHHHLVTHESGRHPFRRKEGFRPMETLQLPQCFRIRWSIDSLLRHPLARLCPSPPVYCDQFFALDHHSPLSRFVPGHHFCAIYLKHNTDAYYRDCLLAMEHPSSSCKSNLHPVVVVQYFVFVRSYDQSERGSRTATDYR